MKTLGRIILIVGASIALGVVGLFIVRQVAPAAWLHANNEVAGNYLQTLGSIYAVLLAFVVFVFAARYVALALARSGAELVPMSILSGLANAGWDLVPLFCILDLSDARSFTLAFGLHTTIFGIRGTIGPTLGTLLYSAGVPLNVLFLGIGAVIALGGVTMLWFARRHPQVVGASSSPAVSS